MAHRALSSPVVVPGSRGNSSDLPNKLFNYIIDRRVEDPCALPDWFKRTEKLRSYTGMYIKIPLTNGIM